MLNYYAKEIQELIESRAWKSLSDFDKIEAVYKFVQNEIVLGFNKYDRLTATEVLHDGIGQCNTKATLLMTLLRALEIPVRLHGSRVTKEFQRSLMPKMMRKLAPPYIVHTWAEVYYNGAWVALEGVITDKRYIEALLNLYPAHRGKFFDYAVAVENFENLQIDWNGQDTFVQSLAVVEDLGVFASPDEFFSEYRQAYRGIKKFLYETVGRKIMTKRAAKIRRQKTDKQSV